MTPLHILTTNPHSPADSIAALLDSNMEAVFSLDNQQKTPLDYARDYNVGGLVGMIVGLCNYRQVCNWIRSLATSRRHASAVRSALNIIE